jgi:putative transposase
MPRKPRLFKAGYIYHVRQRGNNKAALFYSHMDRLIFFRYLREAKSLYPCLLYNYCLMTNHYHFLMEPLEDDNISLFMKQLNGTYAMYLNKKYNRTGTVFEGRFKAGLVQYEEYFAACMRYIELNPVRSKLVETPDQYPWSSYNFHAKREPNTFLHYDNWYLSLGNDFEERCKRYADFVNAKEDENATKIIRERTNKDSIIGSNEFIEKIERESGIILSRERGRPTKGSELV